MTQVHLVRRAPKFSVKLFHSNSSRLSIQHRPKQSEHHVSRLNSVYRGGVQINEHTNNASPKETSLTLTVTPELETEIVGDNIGQKFILKQALTEIIDLENKKEAMPMPASLTVEEWMQLISLTDRRSRFHYIDSLGEGKMTFEEIQELDEKYTSPLKVPENMIQEVCGDDAESRKKIDMFLFFVEEARQIGESVPAELTIKDLKLAVKSHSKNNLRHLVGYLNNLSYQKIKDIRIKRYRSAKLPEASRKKKEDAENCDHIFYGLGHNSFMIRLNDNTIKKQEAWNVWREHIIGQPLVVDFSYLSKLKNNKAFKSMIMNEAAYAVKNNKESRAPFALHFTGVSPENHEAICTLLSIEKEGVNFPVEITTKSHLDLFPREKMVYLSPDSNNDLKRCNEDDIYVVGGIIDIGHDRAPLTLANAKKHKIRHARFPMKRVIGMKADLNVETCVAIMNDLKYSQDWFYSLRWVPSRFFNNRLKAADGGALEHRLIYRAHKVEQIFQKKNLHLLKVTFSF